MKNWLAWKLIAFLTTEILYWLYRGVMLLKAHEDDMPLWLLPFSYIFVGIGYVCDLLYNTLIASIEFRDWPHEGTFTARLKRYKYGLNVAPWRRTKALRICARLDPYDPSGPHCLKK